LGLGLYAISQLIVKKNTDQSVFVGPAHAGKRAWLRDILVLVKEKSFGVVLLSAVGDSLASSSIYVFLGFLLLSRGILPAQLALFTGAFVAGSLSGKTLLGMAVDAFGNRKVFVGSEIAMAVTLIMLVATGQLVLLVIISYLLGAFTRGTGPVIQTMISDVVHEKNFEKAYGVSESLIQVAGATSVLVAGVVADQFGVVAVFYVAAVLAVVATMPVLLFYKR